LEPQLGILWAIWEDVFGDIVGDMADGFRDIVGDMER
jgi:hypothetical protein